MNSNTPHNNSWADYKSPNASINNSRKPATTLLKKASLGRRSNTKSNLGAVRVEPKTSSAFKNIALIGTGMIVSGAALFLHDTLNNGQEKPVKTTSFKEALLNKAPNPVPSPTFRFDDADAASSAELRVNTDILVANRPLESNVFSPMAIAGLLQSRDGEDTDISLVLESLDKAEEELPPLSNTLPTLEFTPTAVDQTQPSLRVEKVVIQSGDTLSGVLYKRGIKQQALSKLLANELVQRHLTRLDIGQELEFSYLDGDQVDSMSVKINRDTRLVMQRSANGYAMETMHLPLEYERVVTSGTIEQSLYLAAEKAKLKQSTIMTLADIFQWELDFSHDIRKGDHFSIVYDRLYRDGKYIGDGAILAAEFVRGNRIHRAIRFTDDENNTAYFSPDGQSKRRAFMRHPVDIVRITSKFDPNRVHPVLHKIRAHNGVDYGAPHGSPIKAVADGRVSYSGKRGTYGQTVILKHDNIRSTLYAHMSKIHKATKVGKRVKQGDIIGYVGKTGRVTGTHLHYELRVKGKHVDPLKVKFPRAEPLNAKYMSKLKAISNELLAQMRSVTESVQKQAAAN